MKKRSLFSILETFTTKQLSKINTLLDTSAYEHNEEVPEKKALAPTFALALDIGSSKITALVGRLDAKGLIEVLGFGEAPSDGLIRGSIANISKISEGIKQAVSLATTQAKIDIREVYSSYSGTITNLVEHGVLLREDPNAEISNDDVSRLRNEMHNAMLPAGERLIYMQAKPYTVDDEPGIKEPVGMSGQRMEADFCLVSASTTPIDHLRKCCTQANLILADIIPAAVCSAEAVICAEEMEEGIAVINIGAAVTSIAIYNKGNLIHTENFPLGGNNISTDIRDFTGLPLRQAEALKNQFGKALATDIPETEVIDVNILNGTKVKHVSRKDLCEVIKSRTEELIAMAYAIVTEALRGDKLIFGIVFTGGVTSLPNFIELAKAVTSEQCHLGDTTLHFAPRKGMTEQAFIKLNAPGNASVAGLLKIALKGPAR
jgi:cell division protein FtsA